MSDDLLATADEAQRAYFQGEFKTKLSIRQCMENLRSAVYAEQKKQAQEDTTRLTKADK